MCEDGVAHSVVAGTVGLNILKYMRLVPHKVLLLPV